MLEDFELTAVVTGITDAVQLAIRRDLDRMDERLTALESSKAAPGTPVRSADTDGAEAFVLGSNFLPGALVTYGGQRWRARFGGRLGTPGQSHGWSPATEDKR